MRNLIIILILVFILTFNLDAQMKSNLNNSIYINSIINKVDNELNTFSRNRIDVTDSIVNLRSELSIVNLVVTNQSKIILDTYYSNDLIRKCEIIIIDDSFGHKEEIFFKKNIPIVYRFDKEVLQVKDELFDSVDDSNKIMNESVIKYILRTIVGIKSK